MSDRPGSPRFVTIGVYGANEAAFFGALQQASVNTFCDIRWRRGMRGREYAFANSARLQKRLAELGIRYLHFRDVAPSPKLREAQAVADKAKGMAKRKRTSLGEVFIAGYKHECLEKFNSTAFVEGLGNEAKVVALFCVEREPAACHRLLLAQRLEQDLGVQVAHVIPGGII
jgi:uncharacterized protein (DUF488 family)